MKNNVFQNATFRCGPENTLAPASGICHFWKMRRDYRLYETSNDEFEQLVVQICARWLGPGVTLFAPGKDGGRDGKFSRKANCAEFGKRRGRRSLMLSDAERATLDEIGHRLGRKVLAEVAIVARPDTILAWYRKLVDRKFSGSQARQGPGRPRVKREVEQLIIRMASENRDWGYDRIAGAMANLGYVISDQTVGNVLRRNGLPPAPERKRTTPWSVFIRTPLGAAGGNRLLHSRGAHAARSGDLLRAIFHPS
jgi:hypothetical protein